MITRMKKLQCLVYHRDYEAFLKQLRQIGVVHVVTSDIRKAENAELRERLDRVRRIERIADQLRAVKVNADVAQVVNTAATGCAERGMEVVARVEAINSRIGELNATIKSATEQVEALRPWGEFEPAGIDRLAEARRTMRFYAVSDKTMDESWLDLPGCVLINKVNGQVYFVSIEAEGEEVKFSGATAVALPRTTLHEAEQTLRTAQEAVPELLTELQVLALQNISDVDAAAEAEACGARFRHVELDTERAADDTLMVMTGWLPEAKEQPVSQSLADSAAWYEISMPTREDVIPTQMSNNKLVTLYETLTNMYGKPNYDEFDATPIISIFFSIFFGFCVGDAGYGLVLLFFGFPICKFLKNGLQLNINPVLVTVLGFAATVMGLILGTAFGVSLADIDAPWISWMHPYMITGKLPGTNYDLQMVAAIAIGVFHLILAIFVKCVGNTIRLGLRAAMVDWAWWLLIVSGVVVGLLTALTTIPAETLKYALLGIGIACAIFIYPLNNPNRSMGVNVGAGLWDTYNMVTGLLGDVLSYIRLYALGLAGGMLGGVFNQLAAQVGDSSEQFGWIFMLLILVLGHVLNLAMSCLSAFVHPLRLTFVEYFKNAGYSGKGVAYEPFK